MSLKLHIKKGDMVIVNAGDDKGTQGRVLEIIQDKKKGRIRAIVEGVNIVTKHTKPNSKNTNGGFVRKEAPVHISNLNPIDPKEKKATRIGRRLENGKVVRYAKKSGEVIK
ncbi:MAG: 50S ribosomal protein L24 [Bacteroidales bacterium]|jgi:large subunit ribosomal protein L24|nr:50S ribosomal protein L24 [Bacteroidales bacterium]